MFKVFEFEGYEVKEKLMKMYLKVYVENSINYAYLIETWTHNTVCMCIITCPCGSTD